MSIFNLCQERKIVGGSQQISEELAKQVKVELNTVASKITWKEEEVVVNTRDGRSFKGAFCILALSPTLWPTIHFEPCLPADHMQLAQRMPMGSIIKTVTFYPRPFWREKGYSVWSLSIHTHAILQFAHITLFFFFHTTSFSNHPRVKS